jgi:hypothetical protein
LERKREGRLREGQREEEGIYLKKVETCFIQPKASRQWPAGMVSTKNVSKYIPSSFFISLPKSF